MTASYTTMRGARNLAQNKLRVAERRIRELERLIAETADVISTGDAKAIIDQAGKLEGAIRRPARSETSSEESK